MSPGDITSWMIIIIASPHNRKMRQKFETFFFVYFHPKIFPYRVRVDQSICSGCVFTSEIKLSFITARMLIKCFFFFFSLAFFSAVRRRTRIESLLSFTLWPLNYFLHWGQTFPEISKKPKKENFCRGNEKKKFNAEKFAGMTSASSWWLVDNIFLHSEQTKCAKFYGKIFVRFFSSVTQRIFFSFSIRFNMRTLQLLSFSLADFIPTLPSYVFLEICLFWLFGNKKRIPMMILCVHASIVNLYNENLIKCSLFFCGHGEECFSCVFDAPQTADETKSERLEKGWSRVVKSLTCHADQRVQLNSRFTSQFSHDKPDFNLTLPLQYTHYKLKTNKLLLWIQLVHFSK